MSSMGRLWTWRASEPDRERLHCGGGNPLLDREDIVQHAVEALGPELCVDPRIDQLHADPELAAGPSDRAAQQVLHPKLAGDRG